MNKKNERLTIRFDGHTHLMLTELVKKLDVSYNLLIRTIVHDFITKNENHLDNIIEK